MFINIVISTVSFLILLISSGTIFPIFAESAAAASKRTLSFIQPLINLFFKTQSYAALASIFASSVYALAASILIYFSFEKTQCQEILFFTFFVFSFCFESLRLIVPLHESLDYPRIYLIIAGRIILFGRVFGVLSLFASSVYAAGFQVQKQSHIILMMIIISMIIAGGMPIDALSWDSALNIVSGYSLMLFLAETGIFFFAIISFFIAIRSKGEKEFFRIGIGSILLFFGRNILLNCDTWIALPVSVTLLTIGTWYVYSRLHQIYLWL